MDDSELIRQADEHHAVCRYFEAAALLKRVSEPSRLTPQHHRILEVAEDGEKLKRDLLPEHPEEEGWKKQTEKHGHRDVIVYYKVNPDTNKIICRIDCPIESSLLNPFIAVLNESELYHTWMPKYTFPVKLGMSESNKLKELGRGHQIVQVKIDMPFPFKNRECIEHGVAIESIDEDSALLLIVHSMDTGSHFEMDVDPVDKGYVRVDFDAGFIFRACPPDHPALAKSKHEYPPNEQLILVSVEQSMDAHVAGVPQRLINWFSRTVLAAQWISLLKIAEEIRDGQSEGHLQAIKEKAELYEWANGLYQLMFDKIAAEHKVEPNNDK